MTRIRRSRVEAERWRGLRQPAAAIVSQALRHASPTLRDAAANVDGQGGDQDLAAQNGLALASSGGAQPLPETIRERIQTMTGDPLLDVRVHNDEAASRTASRFGARAFTLGRNIYFGAGESNTSSKNGLALVAHEAAHTVQQRNAAMPSSGQLTVGPAGDAHEREAERFADAVTQNHASPVRLGIGSSVQVARVQRAISFTSANHVVNNANTMGVVETAAGFNLAPNAVPLFNWTADVTIHGNAGDVFGDWESARHQVMRLDYTNVHWGSGANHGHRLVAVSPLPMRDATGAANTWYDDGLAANGFAASGDVLNTGLNDSPGTRVHPWVILCLAKPGTLAISTTAPHSCPISAPGTFPLERERRPSGQSTPDIGMCRSKAHSMRHGRWERGSSQPGEPSTVAARSTAQAPSSRRCMAARSQITISI